MGLLTRISGANHLKKRFLGSLASAGARSLSTEAGRTSPGEFDVFIVGGGTTGTALFYALSKFTDLRRIALCERRSGYALSASYPKNNSQTIHCGRSGAHARRRHREQLHHGVGQEGEAGGGHPEELPDEAAAGGPERVSAPASARDASDDTQHREGGAEDAHRSRGQGVRVHREALQALQGDLPLDGVPDQGPGAPAPHDAQIAKVEPNVIYRKDGSPRPEDVNALYVRNELTTINFLKLSETFVRTAQQPGKELTTMMNTEVKGVDRLDRGFRVRTTHGEFHSRFVIFGTCGYSLLFAHRMGFGLEYSVLPVAGSFYFSKDILRGKVYTVQNPLLPFAAIHGDPDIVAGNQTRLGPTALPLPLLERYNMASFPDFLKVFRLDHRVLLVYYDLFKQRTIRNYVIKNFLFEVPLLSRWLFLRDARKIVPSLEYSGIVYSQGYGGVRPQLVDKKNRKLLFGESKIRSGDGLIFNISPSPGATTCLANALGDAREVCEFLGASFDEPQVERLLMQGEYAVTT